LSLALQGVAEDYLSVPEKLIRGRADVFDDLTEQQRRDVSTTVDRNRRSTTVGMAELLV